jgi:hypothetical protein
MRTAAAALPKVAVSAGKGNEEGGREHVSGAKVVA